MTQIVFPLIMKFLTPEMLMESILILNREILLGMETPKRNSIQSNKHLLSYYFCMWPYFICSCESKDRMKKKKSQNIQVRRAFKSDYPVQLILQHYLVLRRTFNIRNGTQGHQGIHHLVHAMPNGKGSYMNVPVQSHVIYKTSVREV